MTRTHCHTDRLETISRVASSLPAGHMLLLLGVSLVILIPGTVGVSLFDRDEGWYAQVSREIVQSGDWLIPRYLGEPWLAKPPLLYWLVATSFKCAGMGEWQARLISLLATVANTLLVGELGSRMFGRRVGLLAGLLFVTTGLSVVVGKMVLTDALMLTCTLVAVSVHWHMFTGSVTHLNAFVYWLAIGLGILAKGPATLVFAGMFAVALLWTGQSRSWLFARRWWLWLPIAPAVALPWYLYVSRHAGDTLVSQFLWFEIASRLVSTPHGHGGPPGYYVLLSLPGLLPWTALVPAVVIAAFRSRHDEPNCRLLLIWMATCWAILELIPSKLPHYIVPCVVPLAILGAQAIAQEKWSLVSDQKKPGAIGPALRFWPWTLILPGAGALVIGVLNWQTIWGSPVAGIGGLLVAGFTVVWALVRREARGAAVATALATTTLFHLAAGVWLLPRLEPLRLSRHVAAAINQITQPGDEIRLCGYKEPTTFFYMAGPGRRMAAGDVPSLIASPSSATVLAITRREKQRLPVSIQESLSTLKPTCVTGLNYTRMEKQTVLVYRLVPSHE